MNLFKWTQNLKPSFPNIKEMFFGNKIDDHGKENEIVATLPSINISDRNKAFEV